MKSKHVALVGMLVALAFIFSYIEHLIPLPLPTGVKLGAANIVILCALYFLGWKEAMAISGVRIVLSGFAFGPHRRPRRHQHRQRQPAHCRGGGHCPQLVMYKTNPYLFHYISKDCSLSYREGGHFLCG